MDTTIDGIIARLIFDASGQNEIMKSNAINVIDCLSRFKTDCEIKGNKVLFEDFLANEITILKSNYDTYNYYQIDDKKLSKVNLNSICSIVESVYNIKSRLEVNLFLKNFLREHGFDNKAKSIIAVDFIKAVTSSDDFLKRWDNDLQDSIILNVIRRIKEVENRDCRSLVLLSNVRRINRVVNNDDLNSTYLQKVNELSVRDNLLDAYDLDFINKKVFETGVLGRGDNYLDIERQRDVVRLDLLADYYRSQGMICSDFFEFRSRILDKVKREHDVVFAQCEDFEYKLEK